MPDEQEQTGRHASEIIMGALTGVFGGILLIIAIDVLSGGKLTGRKGCGCDDNAG